MLAILCASTPALLSVATNPSMQKFVRAPSSGLHLATLDLETGVVTRGARVRKQALVTTTDLANLDLSGFLGIDTGGGFCEWMEGAIKGSGNGGSGGPVPSDLISNFVFAYCSSALDPRSGGAGGSVTWSFYPDHALGGPHPATSEAAGVFHITGLPGNTADGAVFAQIRCYFMDVQLGATPLAWADGDVGYSWTFEDLDTLGTIAATFPFLSCVMSCSGHGPDGLAMDNFLEAYCPAGTQGTTPDTFRFCSPPFGGFFTSLNVDVRELDIGASAFTYNGTGINEDVLITSKAIIGQPWSASIQPRMDRSATPPGFNIAIVRVTSSGPPMAPIVVDLAPILIGFGSAPNSELLTTGLGLAQGMIAHNGAGLPSTELSLDIPLNTDLLCMPWHAQAIVLGDIVGDGATDLDPSFSTAAEGIVGAQ